MRSNLGPMHVLMLLVAAGVFAVAQLVAQSPAPVRPKHATSQSSKKTTFKQPKNLSTQPANKKPKDKFHRPPLANTIQPKIQSISRFQPNKVFLEQADSLYKSEHDFTDRQIVKGSVVFRQADMWLYCDSAYYYPERNSLDAFGHVRLKQNSVTSMQADRLFYNGDTRFAKLRCGRSQSKVILRDRQATLVTDSLDYDLNSSLGWYDCGGKLTDGPTTLTSLYGQYNTQDKDAEFFHNVKLHNSADNYTLLTDTLFYNTATKIARIQTPTAITSPDDEILATNGWYNTATGMMQLTSRSQITHRDSLGRATILIGDSLIYDKEKRITYAYSFRNPHNSPTPVEVRDTAHKTILIGGFGLYDQMRQMAMATEYPLLIEFSRPDTLFLRADTIQTFVVSDTIINTDTLSDKTEELKYEWHLAKAYRRARFFNQEAQGIADSMVYSEKDSVLRMYYGPILWSGERQVSGPLIWVHMNDSTVDTAELPVGGTAAEFIDKEEGDSYFNQLRGRYMHATIENKALRRLYVEGNVQAIVLPQETDSTYNRLVNAESSRMSVDLKAQKMEHLKMWPEVSGYVTPLFLLKSGQQLLQGFKWYDYLRPEREWYGERVHWVDNLGEVDEKLEDYFLKNREQGIPDIPERQP